MDEQQQKEQQRIKRLIIGTCAAVFLIVCALGACMLLASCSLSLQNIHTNGTATDLVDENQTENPSVSIPFKSTMPQDKK